jgi:PTS system ascorbate-specific IIA component
MNAILIIAHAPLANALRQCALQSPGLLSNRDGDRRAAQPVARETLGAARVAMQQLTGAGGVQGVLVLTDIFGATPSNVAQKLVDGVGSRLITGVNLPMLLRSVSYRHEPLRPCVARGDRRHPGRDAGGHHGAAEPAPTEP